jgi:hypothetical protein
MRTRPTQLVSDPLMRTAAAVIRNAPGQYDPAMLADCLGVSAERFAYWLQQPAAMPLGRRKHLAHLLQLSRTDVSSALLGAVAMDHDVAAIESIACHNRLLEAVASRGTIDDRMNYVRTVIAAANHAVDYLAGSGMHTFAIGVDRLRTLGPDIASFSDAGYLPAASLIRGIATVCKHSPEEIVALLSPPESPWLGRCGGCDVCTAVLN